MDVEDGVGLVVSVTGGRVVVPGSAPTVVTVAGSEQATTARTEIRTGAIRRIEEPLWHALAATSRNLGDMFGPLNGVRTALVIAAGIAAIVCLIVGYPGAAAILALGVGVHGLGWLYLYSIRNRIKTD